MLIAKKKSAKKQGRISNFMGPLNLSEGHNIHITYTPGRMLKRV